MPAIPETSMSNGTELERSGDILRSVSITNGEKPDSSTTVPACTNNNSLPKEVSLEELELLKKLEAANR
jgi:hypothetical protein